jgi:phage baseplate assembly protein gpV
MGHKSKSITSKASSACKINMGLVQGEADVQNSKAFVNYSSLMEKKLDSGGGKTSSEAVTTDAGDKSKGGEGGDTNKGSTKGQFDVGELGSFDPTKFSN